MAASLLLVMASRWAVSYLHWQPQVGWVREDDRRHSVDDDDVLAMFGSEAFRRRAELESSGSWQYEPLRAEILGRRVHAAVVQAGWDITVDSQSGFKASGDAAEVVVDASFPGVLRLGAPGVEQAVRRVDHAERWVLKAVLDATGVSRVDEIMRADDDQARRS